VKWSVILELKYVSVEIRKGRSKWYLRIPQEEKGCWKAKKQVV
jgi:hypothetical protein